jgi:hypothetical protein
VNDQIIDIETLPCGCVLTRKIEDGRKVFQIAPCRHDCVNLRNALDLADEKGLPVDWRVR